MIQKKQVTTLFALFLALGAFSQIAQALLIRELLVVFHSNEISIGLFYGGWLFWIAVGSWSALWLDKKQPNLHPLNWVKGITLLLPLFLFFQMGLARTLRYVVEVPAGQFIPLDHLFFSTFLLTMPVGWGIGTLFPLAIKGLNPKKTGMITDLYIIESLGALLGALFFTFLCIHFLNTWKTFGVLCVTLGTVAWILPVEHPKKTDWSQLLSLLTILLGFLIVLTPLGNSVQKQMEQIRFTPLHPSLTLVETSETQYGHVNVATLGDQTSIVVNGRISASFPDSRRIALEGALFHTEANNPKRVLLFGGVLNGIAAEFMNYPVERVDAVVEDQTAFQTIRHRLPKNVQTALNDDRFYIHFGDGRDFVHQLPEKPPFDLILVLVSDPSSAGHNRFFTQEFYHQLSKRMQKNGVLCTRVSGASNYLGKEVKSYSGSVYHTLRSVFDHLIVVPGDNHTFCASLSPNVVTDQAEPLIHRYQQTPPTKNILPDNAFHTLLPPDRVTFIKNRLQEEQGELNTDLEPVTFFLNMVLWGKLTASGMAEFLHLLRRMGPWPYLLPTVVFLLIHLIGSLGGNRTPTERDSFNRTSALFAITTLGFVSMAMQIILLFGFQARVGLIFGRIALLNGLFMVGLALGAFFVIRNRTTFNYPIISLMVILFLLSITCFFLPNGVALLSGLNGKSAEIIYYGLSGMVGLLAGGAFPSAVSIAHTLNKNTTITSGLIEAGDHLGGALGGMITGALLVPILGLEGSSNVLSTLLFLTIIPLLLAKKVPFGIRFFRLRSQPSFPTSSFTKPLWFMLFILTLLGWMARDNAPGPRVQFDPIQLTELSGSHHVQFYTKPMPYYLGSNPGTTDRHTLSLASITVAEEIRGYAGPLNLLISMDENGFLKGINLIHSFETPSYIHGLQTWLNGWIGLNPAQHPLNLDDLDGLSGATITSKAALKIINQTVTKGLSTVFHKTYPQTPLEKTSKTIYSYTFVGTVILLLLFWVVTLRGRKKERFYFQFLSLIFLGFYANVMVTEVDLINSGLGHFSTWESNPSWWIVILTSVISMFLLGHSYCGMICPFGVLQEFISRLGEWLGLRLHADQHWERAIRHWKYSLLALTLSMVWLSGNSYWISFNPMQQFFTLTMEKSLWMITGITFLGALFFFRFWCRYWCPLGAFFALGNKLAFWDRWAPKRLLKRCNLGVTHPFDVDCIRCNRCIPETEKITEKITEKQFNTTQPLATYSLLFLMSVMSILVGIHVWSIKENSTQHSGGWRRIDTKEVQSQIGTGRLANHEALWWRPDVKEEKNVVDKP